MSCAVPLCLSPVSLAFSWSISLLSYLRSLLSPLYPLRRPSLSVRFSRLARLRYLATYLRISIYASYLTVRVRMACPFAHAGF